jgi:ubiquinone/menaquinone biosynthesis C-methylase UbiE
MVATDRDYLLKTQYKDASNLSSRINIHQRFGTNKYGWFRWLFDHLDIPEPARVLELACGRGDLWLHNLQRMGMGWEVTLSDLSEGMLAEAKKNLSQSGFPFHFVVMDAQEIHAEKGSINAIIANHVLYHVPDISRALCNIRQALKPGGTFYTSTVGEKHLVELANLVVDFFGDEWKFWGSGFLTERFSLENGMEQIAEHFRNVYLFRYEDALEVTEADPLVEYVYSSNTSPANDNRREEFRAYLQKVLVERGSIHIQKDSGLFVAC